MAEAVMNFPAAPAPSSARLSLIIEASSLTVLEMISVMPISAMLVPLGTNLAIGPTAFSREILFFEQKSTRSLLLL
ncbi:wsv370 [White spot syndrome virus]|uniref:Wsv370 n=4 Tax=White spot syndrome virus TaxID=342409 RepID=Q8VAN1_WSSVS|nr:wsv370 [Shrimp white spot syndrome virus]AFX59747.1 wsv370 [White spot syndrome virus]AAL33372.1 wsv370 [Shrimp white spot syndrome virus]AAL89297.1 WSSV429 [Shrimp white spot syndrome virus]AWQ60496.1 wsv370 [Shrimp white spot syndrome virus]AWQ60941.1 wsv370 [Shrimp white spot syndrome virus]